MISASSYLKIDDSRVVLDVDGVLLDFDDGFSKVGAEVLGRPVIRRTRFFDLTVRYGLTPAELANVWSAMDDHPCGWSSIQLLPGASEAFQMLKSHGRSIHLVTGIPQKLAETRLANFALHGLSPDSIDCVGDGKASKLEHVLKHAPGMFVDDRLRLLYESDFVPNRVWVDHGDDQDGHVVDESIIRVESLLQWVKQWTLSSRPARKFPYLVS